MSDTENLGEYKVVVTVDYQQMKAQMDAAKNYIRESADVMKATMDGMSAGVGDVIDRMSKSIATAMSSSSKSVGEFSNAVSKINSGEAAGGMDKLSDSTTRAGNSARQASNEYESMEKRVRALRVAAQEAFEAGNMDSAKKNWQDADNLLKSFNSSIDETGNRQKQLNSLTSQYNTVWQRAQEYIRSSTQASEKAFDSMNTKMNNIFSQMQKLGYQGPNKNPFAQFGGNYDQYAAPFRAAQQAQTQLKNLSAQYWQDEEARIRQNTADHRAFWTQRVQAENQYEALVNKVNSYLQTQTHIPERTFAVMKQQMAEYQAQLASMNVVPKMADPLANFKGFDAYNKSLDGAIKKTNVFSDAVTSLKHHMAWMGTAVLMAGITAIPMAISNAIESFDALNTKITQNMELADQYHGNNAQLEADMQKMGEAAQAYSVGFGVSMEEVQNAMQIITRRFKDVSTATYLTGVALKMSKLDFVDVTKSARDLESVLLQFGLGANQAGNFLNDFSVILHTARINGTEMLDALERSGSAFKALNMDSREAMAAIAALSTETGRTGATIGETFKSIAANMDLKKATAALKAYNISLYEVDNTGKKVMRDGATVFQEIQKKFQQLDDEGQRKLAYAIAGGKYQSNAMMAFLKDANGNFTKYLNDMKSKSSDAMTKQLLQKSMNTYQTQIGRLKASMQVLAMTIGNAVLPKLKSFVSTLTGVTMFLKAHVAEISRVASIIGHLALIYLAVKGAALLWAGAEAIATGMLAAKTAVMGAIATVTGIANIAMLAYNLLVGGMSVAEAGATVATGALAMAVTALEAVLTPILITVALVIAALVLLGVALYELYEHWDEYSKDIEDVWNTLVEVIADVIQVAIVALIPFMVQMYALAQVVRFVIQEVIVPIFKWLANQVRYVVSVIKGFLDRHAAQVQACMQFVANIFHWVIAQIHSVAPGFADFLEGMIGKLWSFAQRVFSIADEVRKAIKSIFSIGDEADSGEDSESIVSKIKNYVTNAENQVETLQQSAKEDMANSPYNSAPPPSGGSEPNAIPEGGAGKKGKKDNIGKTPPDNSPERLAHDMLAKGGLSEEMIAGILGNISLESGFDPTADNGSHRGIVQWGTAPGDRWDDLVAYAKSTNSNENELATQVSFILYELKHGESQAYSSIMASGATTPEQFAMQLDLKYERSGNSAGDANDWERQKAARGYYGRFAEGEGKKKKLVNPMERMQAGYEELEKVYQSRVAEAKLAARNKGAGFNKQNELDIFDSVFGSGGKNINTSTSTTSTGSGIGAAIVNSANTLFSKYAGQQWSAATNGTRGDSNGDLVRQCASFVSEIVKQAGITSIGSAAVDSLSSQAGKAYHSAGSYTPKAGDLVVYEGHVAVYMGDGNYVARNSSGGVHKGSMAEGTNYFGAPVGYIASGELPEAKNFKGNTTTSQGNSPYAVLEKYKTKRAELADSATKENLEIDNAKYAYDFMKKAAGVEWIHKVEKVIIETAKTNPMDLSKVQRQILENMNKSMTLGAGTKEKYDEDAKRFELELQLRQKAEEVARKAVEEHGKALSEMAQKEIEFAQKLGLLSDRDVYAYNVNKNETDFAKQKPLLEDELMHTAQSGRGSEMLKAYKQLMDAENDVDAERAAKTLVNLSQNVEETQKALEKMQAAYEKYYARKYELEQQDFQYANRYVIGMRDTFVDSWEQALEDTINRTKSFSENIQGIFKAMWSSLVKQFSTDWATKIKKIISEGLFQPQNTGHVAGAMAGHYGASAPAVMGGYELPSLAGSMFSKGSFMGTGKKANGNIKSPVSFGSFSLIDGIIPKNAGTLITQRMAPVKAAIQQTASTMTTLASTTQQTVSSQVKQGVTAMVQGETTKRMASKATAASVQADGAATQTSVIASIGAMVTQMLAAMAVMWALSSLFGGGGSHSSTSTSAVNLGRSPNSYYMTPTAVMQSTTIPSMDIGGNVERDMLIFAHKNEMVLTPEQAGVIRDTAKSGGSNGGGPNANVKSSISVSTVDSKGFDRVLKNYNRTLSKQVKNGVRNGYLSATGLT